MALSLPKNGDDISSRNSVSAIYLGRKFDLSEVPSSDAVEFGLVARSVSVSHGLKPYAKGHRSFCAPPNAFSTSAQESLSTTTLGPGRKTFQPCAPQSRMQSFWKGDVSCPHYTCTAFAADAFTFLGKRRFAAGNRFQLDPGWDAQNDRYSFAPTNEDLISDGDLCARDHSGSSVYEVGSDSGQRVVFDGQNGTQRFTDSWDVAAAGVDDTVICDSGFDPNNPGLTVTMPDAFGVPALAGQEF